MVIDPLGIQESFEMYNFETMQYIRSFHPPLAGEGQSEAKQVAFANGAKHLVGGSCHGRVNVFDRRTGKLIQALGIREGLVAVSVSQGDAAINSKKLTS